MGVFRLWDRADDPILEGCRILALVDGSVDNVHDEPGQCFVQLLGDNDVIQM